MVLSGSSTSRIATNAMANTARKEVIAPHPSPPASGPRTVAAGRHGRRDGMGGGTAWAGSVGVPPARRAGHTLAGDEYLAGGRRRDLRTGRLRSRSAGIADA